MQLSEVALTSVGATPGFLGTSRPGRPGRRVVRPIHVITISDMSGHTKDHVRDTRAVLIPVVHRFRAQIGPGAVRGQAANKLTSAPTVRNSLLHFRVTLQEGVKHVAVGTS